MRAVITLEGWSAAGPSTDGPGGVVQPVRDRAGAPHVALQYRPDLADHPMLSTGMDPVAAFVQKPGVAGVAPLVAWDRRRATFVYPAGEGVLLAQILARQRKPAGVRAALELVQALGPVLEDAARAGRRTGLPGHGALSPWRILVHPDRTVSVVGHGLPPLEITTWLEQETDTEPGPGLRYFPPERIDEQDEDLRSDLYALAACAAELALGRPLVEGDARALVDRILDGGAAAAVDRAGLDPDVRSLLAQALAVDPADRGASGKALAQRAGALARGREGLSLFDLVAPAPDPIDEDTSVSYSKPDGETNLSPHVRRVRARDDDDGMRPVPMPGRTPDPPARPGPTPASALQGDVERTDVIGIPPELLEALSGRDPNAPPPPIPDLPTNATLVRIQDHARKIVERAGQLATRAAATVERVVERAAGDPAHDGVVRVARIAGDRARKAAEAARSASNLIDLDEDAAGAMITLDLVRNAEVQCEAALGDTATQLKELDRVAERVQAQARALAEAARRATDHADRATDAANQADDLVTVLEEEVREGLLSAAGVTAVVDEAVACAERAHAAAEEARAHADQAGHADRADLGMRYAEQARRAEEQALAGLAATREAADRARRLEGGARADALALAEERLAAARLAAEEAWRALQRADEGLKIAAAHDSRRLRDACAGFVRDAEAAATEADRAAAHARGSDHARGAVAHAEAVEQAASRAEAATRKAADASDEVVRLAGAFAEKRARLSKLQEETRSLAEKARAVATRARDDVDRLLDETSRLAGEAVLGHRSAALQAVRAAEDAFGRLDERARAAASASEAGAVDGGLGELRSLAAEIVRLGEEARTRSADARDAAETEIADLKRRDEARKAVAQAAGQAREHARSCRQKVDAAWQVARNLSEALRATEVDEAVRLRTKALEIIDIAEFQAGEAHASADNAATEEDPAEARAHALTAASFLERVTADLPEALEALATAEQLARREVDGIAAARARTSEAAAQVEQLATDARSAVRAAREDAHDWRTDGAVGAQLTAAEATLATFEEDRNESGWARDRAREARTAAEAVEHVPTADGALGRARDKKRRLDAQVEALRRAVSAAESAAGAVEEARRSTRTALDAVLAHLARLASAEHRLRDAMSRHDARDEAVANAELGLREAHSAAKRVRAQLERLVLEADTIEAPEAARALAARAAAFKADAERAAEVGAEAETRGVAAAEQESRARVEAQKRRLDAARDEAHAHARRARQDLDRVESAFDETEDTGALANADVARARFEEAGRLLDLARAQMAEIERVAGEATAAVDVERAHAVAERVKALGDKLAADAARALAVVQDARDLARAAAAEAEALDGVRSEVRSTADKAEEAVERARGEARRILAILREVPRSDVRALADEATQQIQTATKAAAKARAATPLAEQAPSHEAAQSILKATRMALERANAAADLVRDLVDRAVERLRQEKEAAAQALDDARARAAEPAQEAVAAAKKAEGWLDAGRREASEAGETPATRTALQVLERAVADVRRRSDDAATRAVRAAQADTIEAADAVLVDSRALADGALDAARTARAALDELRAQIGKVKAEADTVAALAAEAADQAAAATQVAEQGEATLRELEGAFEELSDASPALLEALETVRTAATNARFAAATAGTSAERAKLARTRATVEPAAAQAQAALEDALDALERVVAAEQACRAAIDRHRAARRDTERAAEERRRREEESDRRAAQEAERRAREEDDERRRRDDERRAKFERRREERAFRTSGAASDRESLRSMLKARPSSTGPAPADSARPRRIGEARDKSAAPEPSDPQSPETTARNVRSWKPSKSSDTSSSRVRRRPTAERPTGERSPTPAPTERRAAAARDAEEVTEPRSGPASMGSSGDAPRVDALLERLRSRRSDKD